jgi:hypothetical protein
MVTDRPEITKVQLEKLKLAVMAVIPEELIDPQVEFSLHTSFITESIAMRVKGHIWAEHVDAIDIQYPADWWQAVKERFAPKFVLNRWPVKYTKHRIDVKAAYPGFRPALRDSDWRFSVVHSSGTYPEIVS